MTYNQSSRMSANEEDNNIITFQVDMDDIKEYIGDEGYFYVGVVCDMSVADATTNNTSLSEYRYIFETLQMSQTRPTNRWAYFNLHVKFAFAWILVPLILIGIVLFLGWRCCIRNSRRLM
jgi:hypothetical protein